MTTEVINQMQVLLKDEQQMYLFGEKIAQAIGQINAPLLILLNGDLGACLLYTSPSPRDGLLSRMPSSA